MATIRNLSLVDASHPALRTKCEPVVSVDFETIRQMLKSKGVGLAAPQVGLPIRLFVTAWGEVFVNPEIVEQTTDACFDIEGCLSLPGQQVRVMRSSQVVLQDGKRYTDLQARVIQHEIDHLNGKLITDYL